ncbi:MAG TPA: hypothetical protein VK112_07375 [Fodinibius sp.]|nr:hypothetical protein [Fodinibius sp.]
MIRTILFIVLMYLLIKVISRLFLTSSSQEGQRSNARVFYESFRQFQQGQQGQQRQQSKKQQGNDKFEGIEEAEFEDITEDDNSAAKSSD